MAEPKRLVIVESPAKAKTIGSYLGPGYIVNSSLGHVRDLPRSAKEIPAKYKDKPWSRLGVNVEENFTALYIVNPDRKDHVKQLKAEMAEADELYLATDEDREGEAIAWHLLETLKPKIPVRRMVFHEITPNAIAEAVANPRELNQNLVDAQEARRILDRLYGYEVSPVLWKKVMPRLSAGRVQSVATRILVERERSRMAFHAADYWDITARLGTSEGETFKATLSALDGTKIASGKDFDAATGQAKSNVVALDEAGANGLAERLADAPFQVVRIEKKPYRRRPYAPFITSTLQQDASRKLRLSSAQTMRVAQRLYENGHITYMRTDSTNLSETAVQAARRQAGQMFGEKFVPAEPRRYARKVKNAQEAHEAIRPAGDRFARPDELKAQLTPEEYRLYDLIWRRTVASQMTDATGNSTSVRTRATSSTGEEADFTATGKTVTNPGFLKAYADDDDKATDNRLPELTEREELTERGLLPVGHTTQPPARYTEATLVKFLEEKGIGRPSTYASIMQTIQDRGYAFKRGQALVPSLLAFAVVRLMERHFPQLVNYDFTAGMENELDEVAAGHAQAVKFLRSFYFGGEGTDESVSASGGLKNLVDQELGEIDARGVNSIPIYTDDEERRIVARVGRYGPYLERASDSQREAGEPGDRVSIPASLAPDELTREKVEELYDLASAEGELGTHPDTGEPVIAKTGRYGPYVTCGEKTASLLSYQNLKDLTLENAVQLLTLPRLVGVDDDGEEIRTGAGPHGPYVVKKRDYRSLENEDQLFTLTMEQAKKLLAEPKSRGRRARASEPLKDLGADPVTGKDVTVKDGRFGPFVTDGETNASLRRTDTIEAMTIDRAAELLSERREKIAAGGGKKKAAKKSTKKSAKKTTKKTAKKAAKKTTAKKAAKKTAKKTAKKAVKKTAKAAKKSTKKAS
ncbi:type I DNA topoisomerase [Haloglycomyces albus]|uniref:type I DNA topoisomerase n=1 Tax=Haloglycomyces albus TaxID=526067 RepID=UPI00046D6CD3|nr:type I DNA topoisomerase [Haloglycomyces albus]